MQEKKKGFPPNYFFNCSITQRNQVRGSHVKVSISSPSSSSSLLLYLISAIIMMIMLYENCLNCRIVTTPGKPLSGMTFAVIGRLQQSKVNEN